MPRLPHISTSKVSVTIVQPPYWFAHLNGHEVVCNMRYKQASKQASISEQASEQASKLVFTFASSNAVLLYTGC